MDEFVETQEFAIDEADIGDLFGAEAAGVADALERAETAEPMPDLPAAETEGADSLRDFRQGT